eukprot:TRINITY_DN213_c1_g1_i1.p2 TRINITY_DN213_c1_g1~~TRINITY_DN213_c1_g1_i1.p2  ORF type:complete len:120 (-),score=22.24 TRINITY_DN213_c1_g1_i1:52-411(-)
MNIFKPPVAKLLCDFNEEKALAGGKKHKGLPGQKLSASRRSEDFRRTKDFRSLLDHSCTPQRQGLKGAKLTKRVKWRTFQGQGLCRVGKCEEALNWGLEGKRPATSFDVRNFKLCSCSA